MQSVVRHYEWGGRHGFENACFRACHRGVGHLPRPTYKAGFVQYVQMDALHDWLVTCPL